MSIKVDHGRLKSIEVENHKKLWNRLLSISDTCQLISIEFELTMIDFYGLSKLSTCYVLLFVNALQPLSLT